MTITNPDSGLYKINFLNPTTEPPSYWQSDELAADASASTFRNRIWNYYWGNYRTNIEVTKTMFDVAGVETADAALQTSAIYNIKVLKRINGYSANAVSVSVIDSAATISPTAPMMATASSAPLSGAFRIKCTDDLAVDHFTYDLSYDYWTNGI